MSESVIELQKPDKVVSSNPSSKAGGGIRSTWDKTQPVNLIRRYDSLSSPSTCSHSSGKTEHEIDEISSAESTVLQRTYQWLHRNGDSTSSLKNAAKKWSTVQLSEDLDATVQNEAKIITNGASVAELEGSLPSPLHSARLARDRFERLYRERCTSEADLRTEMNRLRLEHEQKHRELVHDARKQNTKAQREIWKLERLIDVKEEELYKLELNLQDQKQEKDAMMGEINRLKNQGLHKLHEAAMLVNKKSVSEKERSLVRQTNLLNTQLLKLQKECKCLKSENEHLKRQLELVKHKPNETKEKDRLRERELKELKKKNTTLVVEARKLQDQVRLILGQSNKVKNGSDPKHRSSAEVIRQASAVNRRTATREVADLTQKVTEKDRKIRLLESKCNELRNKLDNALSTTNLKPRTTANRNKNCKVPPSIAGNTQRLNNMEKAELNSKVAELQQKLERYRDVDVEHYLDLVESNKMNSRKVDELNRMMESHGQVARERDALRSSLGSTEKQLFSAKCHVNELEGRVSDMESVRRQMQEATERRRVLEVEHAEAMAQLQLRQEELKNLRYGQDAERRKNNEIIENLKSKLRELEKKCELQNVHHEELALEMTSIKKSQAWANSRSSSFNQPEEELPNGSSGKQLSTDAGTKSVSFALNHNSSLSGIDSALSDRISSVVLSSSATTPSASYGTAYSSGSSVHTSGYNSPILSRSSLVNCPSPSARDRYSSTNKSDIVLPPGVSVVPGGITLPLVAAASLRDSVGQSKRSVSTATGTDDLITARGIENYTSASHTHRVLPVGGSISSSSQTIGSSAIATSRTPPLIASSSEIDRIMAKIERDNKILAELDKTRATLGLIHPYASQVKPDPPKPPPAPISSTKPTSIPSIVTTQYDTATETQRLIEADFQHTIELPGRGRVWVYVARYSYDPYQQSPNENPEAELNLNAGDYVVIHSAMDEDGFYDGELLDGRRGLVPSNFVEKLTGDDLVDFQQTVLYGDRDSNESYTSIPADLDFSNFEDSQALFEELRRVDLPFLELEDIEEADDEAVAMMHNGGMMPNTFFSLLVPPPVRLTLERQLNKSIIIGWSHTMDGPESIEAYQVYVDGQLKTTIRSTDRPRALIEGVDSNRLHRVSIRAVTHNRRTSRDAACTMVIGKDVPLAPTCVRALNVTANSATISWLPSNSNYQHVVCVNNVEVRVVKPGVYRHTISGLTPNTAYRVTIRVKNIKAPQPQTAPTHGALGTTVLPDDCKNTKKLDQIVSSHIDFRTLPTGLPDPPLDVQVEPGPQEGTILVTWLPVTITSGGMSNGSPVTGYAVFAEGRRIIDIDSPTGDHVLIELTRLEGTLPKSVTVRTKSMELLSTEASTAKIPNDLLKAAKNRIMDKGMGRDAYGRRMDGYHDPNRAMSPRRDPRDRRDDRDRGMRDGRAPPGGRMNQRRPHDERGMGRHTPPRERDRSGGMDHPRDRVPPPHHDRGHPIRRPPPGSHGPPGPGAPPSAFERRQGPQRRRYDAQGQAIIEPDENMSDREIYPGSQGIPQIEITNPMDGSHLQQRGGEYPEDEYGHRRRGRGPRGPPNQAYRGDPRDQPNPRNPDRQYYDREGSRDRHRPADDFNRRGGPPVGPPGPGMNQRHPNEGPPLIPPQGPPGQRPQAHRANEQTRLFVALFDYDPKTMSPNPDAAEEELPFREGDYISIYGDKDADGFYWGKLNNRQGLVPCNMVSLAPQNDQSAMQQGGHVQPGPMGAQPPRAVGATNPRQAGMRGGISNDRRREQYQNYQPRKMVALYDYDPQELSPNVDAEAELSFTTGEIVYIYGPMDEDGFYMGEINGMRGLVPSNFLADSPQDYRDGQTAVGGPGQQGNVGMNMNMNAQTGQVDQTHAQYGEDPRKMVGQQNMDSRSAGHQQQQRPW